MMIECITSSPSKQIDLILFSSPRSRPRHQGRLEEEKRERKIVVKKKGTRNDGLSQENEADSVCARSVLYLSDGSAPG